MQVPLQISFQNVEHSQAIEDRIQAEAEKLESFYDRITSASIVVSRPQRRHHKGDVYEIRMRLTVPGAADIVVSREPGDRHAHTDIYISIRDAFGAARRQLQNLARIRQNNVKTHQEPPHGHIASLRSEANHGFIATTDGREIYFHRNSVANECFDDLSIGLSVRFAEGRGDKGPQATYVQPIGKRSTD
ncbi:MAG: HPF/RaiA family ribosome-associated protein [Hyphomicrobiaceae bacterium]